MNVNTRLQMNGDVIGTRFGEAVDHRFWIPHHQVCVHRQRGVPPQIFDHFGPEGQVRHEGTVHHIEVDPICACALGGFETFGHGGKIG
jgi:hypothetical protein